MANVIRLTNGGSIQVRTGVIQGIGPQGPTGVSGPQGNDGPQGPQGEVGPMGQILQLQSKTSVASNNPLAANTDTVISFGSVAIGQNDLACFTDASTITLANAGDYLLSAWLRFDDAAATIRDLWFASSGVTIARTSRIAAPGSAFYADLVYPFRAAGGEVINVLARSGTATGVSLGALTVTRVGSGPPGPQGPVGPQGPIGATGAQGPQGAPGSASSGFATYADLLP